MPKGSVPRKNSRKAVLKTKPVSGGAQQYVRGSTPMARVYTASRSSNVAANEGERAFRKNNIGYSNKMYRASDMLYDAQVVEAKEEMQRRRVNKIKRPKSGKKK